VEIAAVDGAVEQVEPSAGRPGVLRSHRYRRYAVGFQGFANLHELVPGLGRSKIVFGENVFVIVHGPPIPALRHEVDFSIIGTGYFERCGEFLGHFSAGEYGVDRLEQSFFGKYLHAVSGEPGYDIGSRGRCKPVGQLSLELLVGKRVDGYLDGRVGGLESIDYFLECRLGGFVRHVGIDDQFRFLRCFRA